MRALRLGALSVCALAVLLCLSTPVKAPTNTAVVDGDFDELCMGIGESHEGAGVHFWEKPPLTWDVVWDGVQYSWIDLGGGSGYYETGDTSVVLRIRVTDGNPRSYQMTIQPPGLPEEAYDSGDVFPE